LAAALSAAAVPLPAGVALRWWVGTTTTATVLAALVAGVPLAAMAATACLTAPVVALHHARHRRALRRDRQLPDALEAMAAAVRTGSSLRQALEEVAATAGEPLGDELRTLDRAVARGAPLAEAARTWTTSTTSRAVQLASAALIVGARAGGPVARALDAVATTLRDREAAAAEVRSLATQARASAGVMTIAPLAFALVALVTDSRGAAFLLRSGPGLGCLAAGLALDLIGAAWMARITAVAP
jgi:tight adherence protein B